jgi:hypothetical protein
MVTVDYDELSLAFDFVSSGDAFEAEATEPALGAWCRENDIHLGERGTGASA